VPKRVFDAELKPSGRGGGHLVDVPADVVEALGGKGRIAVKASFNGVPYQGSIVRMGGRSILGVQKAIMAQAGVGPGGILSVAVEVDDEPREVDVPGELARTLRRNKVARKHFESLSYSHRRDYAGYVAEAKRSETRTKRADRAIEMLVEQAKAGKRKR
jgi:hypothetical protein